MARECGGCTECCRWIPAIAYGKEFYPGNPCHFVSEKGCTIYEKRPDFCMGFKCGWLLDEEVFPEWLKPNVSKVLAQKSTTKNGIEFYKITECGQKIDASVLNYLILYALKNPINFNIQVGGGWVSYGSKEFLNGAERGYGVVRE